MSKRGRIALAQALKAITAYQHVPIHFVDIELDESLKAADDLGTYAYDAYLIQTALEYRSPRLTLDADLFEGA